MTDTYPMKERQVKDMNKYECKCLIERIDYCIRKTKQEDLKDDRKVKYILHKGNKCEGFARVPDIAKKLNTTVGKVNYLLINGSGELAQKGYTLSKVGEKPVKGKNLILVQLKDGVEVATYNNQKEAAKKIGSTSQQISTCLNGTISTLYGYTFEWRN